MTEFTKTKIAFALALLAALFAIYPISIQQHEVTFGGLCFPVGILKTSANMFLVRWICLPEVQIAAWLVYLILTIPFLGSVYFYGLLLLTEKKNAWSETVANYCFLLGFFLLAAVSELVLADYLCRIFSAHPISFIISAITLGAVFIQAIFAWLNLRALHYKDIHAQFLSSEKEKLLSLEAKQSALGDSHIRLVQPLVDLAELYTSYGRYTDAQALLERAYDITKKQLGSDHPLTIARQLSKAANYHEQGMYLQSKELYDQEIAQLNTNAYTDDALLANALLGRAKNLRLLTQNTLAQCDLAASMKMSEKQFSNDAEHGLLQCLIEEALLHIESASYADAEGILAKVFFTMHRNKIDPLIRVAALEAKGQLLLSQYNFRQAETFFDKCLVLLKTTFGESHPYIGNILSDRAVLLHSQAKYVAAEVLYNQAIKVLTSSLGPRHFGTLAVLFRLGMLKRDLSLYPEADRIYRHILSDAQAVVGDSHLLVGLVLEQYALLEAQQGRLRQALRLGRESLKTTVSVVGRHHPHTARVINSLGDVYYASRHTVKAETCFRASIRIRERATGRNHPSVAASLCNLAVLKMEQSDYDAANDLVSEALQIHRQKDGDKHPNIASILAIKASLESKQANFDDALRTFERIHHINHQFLPPNHPNNARYQHNLAGLYCELGRYKEADDLYQKALDQLIQTYGSASTKVASTLNAAASLKHSLLQNDIAEDMYKRALQIQRDAFGEESIEVATTTQNLALLLEQKNPAEAEGLYKQALNSFELAFGAKHPDVATVLNNLGKLYQSQNKTQEAEKCIRSSLAIREKTFGTKHPDTASSMNSLSVLLRQANPKEAEHYANTAVETLEHCFGGSHQNLAIVLSNLAEIYVLKKEYTKAYPIMGRALKIAQHHQDPDIIATVHCKFAILCRLADKMDDAENHLRTALTLIEGKKDRLEIQVLQELLTLLQNNPPHTSLPPLFERLLVLRKKVFGNNDTSLKDVLESYHSVLLALNRSTEAEAIMVRITKLG
jgi:tetratricopeptide (TPR) repeat protein